MKWLDKNYAINATKGLTVSRGPDLVINWDDEPGMDKASLAKADRLNRPGGIDFQSDKFKNVLQVQNNGDQIRFHIDRAMLQQLQNAPGFKPTIIKMQSLPAGQAGVADLRMFLGLES